MELENNNENDIRNEFEKVLRKEGTILELRNELNKYYNSIDDDLKVYFLDYAELIYLIQRKAKIKNDVDLLKNLGGIIEIEEIENARTSFIGKWVNEKAIEETIKENDSNIDIDLSDSKVKYNLTQTELIELIKSMIENGNIKGLQKDVIKEISDFMNIKIDNPDKIIQDIKNRSTGSETLYLDKLKSSLYNYIQK